MYFKETLYRSSQPHWDLFLIHKREQVFIPSTVSCLVRLLQVSSFQSFFQEGKPALEVRFCKVCVIHHEISRFPTASRALASWIRVLSSLLSGCETLGADFLCGASPAWEAATRSLGACKGTCLIYKQVLCSTLCPQPATLRAPLTLLSHWPFTASLPGRPRQEAGRLGGRGPGEGGRQVLSATKWQRLDLTPASLRCGVYASRYMCHC